MTKTRQIDTKLSAYVRTNCPIGTNPGKVFKISSIAGKNNSKNFTINISSKVTAKQIFAIKEWMDWDSYRAPSKTEKFPVYVVDKSNGRKYYGIATATQGSKKLSVTLYNLKLKKGKTYQLFGTEYWSTMKNTWTKGKSFKIK